MFRLGALLGARARSLNGPIPGLAAAASVCSLVEIMAYCAVDNDDDDDHRQALQAAVEAKGVPAKVKLQARRHEENAAKKPEDIGALPCVPLQHHTTLLRPSKHRAPPPSPPKHTPDAQHSPARVYNPLPVCPAAHELYRNSSKEDKDNAGRQAPRSLRMSDAMLAIEAAGLQDARTRAEGA